MIQTSSSLSEFCHHQKKKNKVNFFFFPDLSDWKLLFQCHDVQLKCGLWKMGQTLFFEDLGMMESALICDHIHLSLVSCRGVWQRNCDTQRYCDVLVLQLSLMKVQISIIPSWCILLNLLSGIHCEAHICGFLDRCLNKYWINRSEIKYRCQHSVALRMNCDHLVVL